ncbi:MAG: ADP-ribosylglycohydrolase family protein [Victivallales bacterium]|nr:ADP-ribosylglycohydrolase family protein [Victivallales bacterium]
MLKLNLNTYRDKVLGCWMGKNIGGTLGGPFEGRREMNDATFYVQKMDGKPLPNDDLDLQLLWLRAAEEKGILNLNERVLAEYWSYENIGPWNEYGVSKCNIARGFMPPMSGSCNNDVWKWSNGAWIRSEIWACFFPGMPDVACKYAYYDSCIDHCGEGIYAEMFTASMESAAFLLDDVRSVIEFGVARIPEDSRVAQAVRLACDCYDKHVPFAEAREKIVQDSADLGWFQAPGNLGFTTLGLLYGEGDFGKAVCLAANCGDDTDCTAGTAGAVMGIMLGINGIPEKWTKPIGDSIQTCCVLPNPNSHLGGDIPHTVTELTERTIRQARLYSMSTIFETVQFTDGPTEIPEGYVEKQKSSDFVRKEIISRPQYRMGYDLPYGVIFVRFDQCPDIEPGKPIRMYFSMSYSFFIETMVSIKLELPDGWKVSPADECCMVNKASLRDPATGSRKAECAFTVIPGEFSGAMFYLKATITLRGRTLPYTISIPLQRKGSAVLEYK